MDVNSALSILENHAEYRVLRRVAAFAGADRPAGHEPGFALIVDTETTGLDTKSCKCIELGMLLVEYDRQSGSVVAEAGRYSGLQDPGEPLSVEVQRVTGLTNADLEGQVFDETMIAGLVDQADIVIAHNAQFDRPILERYWPAFVEKRFLCSLKQIDWPALGMSSGKLEWLAYSLGMFYPAHRAIEDCVALLAVLLHEIEGQTGFSRLLSTLDSASYVLNLTVPFDFKDKLKALGSFRWLDQSESFYFPKSWLLETGSKEDTRRMLKEIRDKVFNGCGFSCQIGKLSADNRFSVVKRPELKSFSMTTIGESAHRTRYA
ncbi:3'-5' exonuclease [Laribacter hongkongensis]|uniref:3'-5' exonuclease n=1 Tax=Laribacter hongkongensis TaxID=168471 RepID=UPI001EFD7E5B|nr:3'-5' exonuclease [Laribacter hongkongensis]